MSVVSNFDESTNRLLISVGDRMTFDHYRAFLEAYKEHVDAARAVCVDLRKTKHIDSSVLGILLRLKEKIGSKPISLRLMADSDVHEILQIARFDLLFELEPAR